jgi:hypothetical protein
VTLSDVRGVAVRIPSLPRTPMSASVLWEILSRDMGEYERARQFLAGHVTNDWPEDIFTDADVAAHLSARCLAWAKAEAEADRREREAADWHADMGRILDTSRPLPLERLGRPGR